MESCNVGHAFGKLWCSFVAASLLTILIVPLQFAVAQTPIPRQGIISTNGAGGGGVGGGGGPTCETPPSITITSPADGAALTGGSSSDPTKADLVRYERNFYATIWARVEPTSFADTATVTFTITLEGGGGGAPAAGVYTGSGVFRTNPWDIRTLNTFLTPRRRFRIDAYASNGSQSATATPIYVDINKGAQITTLAGDFSHYPYHFGGKGTAYCPNVDTTDPGDPDTIDGSIHHSGYVTGTGTTSNNHQPRHTNGTANGAHPICLDCSGYSKVCYDRVGCFLPDGSSAQCGALPVVTPRHTGDLLFWTNNGQVSGVHHVAIAVGTSGSSVYEALETGTWSGSGSHGSYDYCRGPSGNGWFMSP